MNLYSVFYTDTGERATCFNFKSEAEASLYLEPGAVVLPLSITDSGMQIVHYPEWMLAQLDDDEELDMGRAA
jgi:hypothetical protein